MKIQRIIESELCIGCGLCEAIGASHGYKMELRSNGFYYPTQPDGFSQRIDKEINEICPSINIINPGELSVWGTVKEAVYAYSTNPTIRNYSSSGGVISATCIYLLEKNIVDSVLHVGASQNSHLYNELSESFNRDDVLRKSSSRYAPVVVLNNIINYFQSSERTFCVVGKPCDIQALNLLLDKRPEYRDRVKFTIAIFCGGMPTYLATEQLLEKLRPGKVPVSVRYRGDGWPGHFKAEYSDGQVFKMSYNESWGSHLGRKVHFRCKICPDGIGLAADMAVGDAWETANGYPDFTEHQGRSFVLLRTERSQQILQMMKQADAIICTDLNLNILDLMQPFQYKRRLEVGVKIAVVSVMSFVRFKIDNVWSPLFLRKLRVAEILKIIPGTIKRSFSRNKF